MSCRSDRNETEKNFIDKLISNALLKFEQCRTLPQSQKDTITHLAKYRINIVATKLEKLLSKKTLDFHSYSSRRNQMTPAHKTKFIDEILFLLDIILVITKSYSTSHVDATRSVENAEELSKHSCSQLISTVGGVVYFQSQFQEAVSSRKLSAACGEIMMTISEINEECTLFHMSQIFKQCIEPNAEVRGSFYTLQTLQYIRLKTNGMLVLFSLLSNVIDQPTNALNPNFGNWKKSAMLEISAPLRVCMLKWLEFDHSAMTSLLISPASDEDNPSMLALYNKFEPWASGAKRKSAVWPLMCLLLALMPRTFYTAANDHRKKSSVARVLRKTVDNLHVSAMRSVLQKDSVLNTELSVISIVLMFKVAASLQRSLCYSSSERSGSSNSPRRAYSTTTTDSDAQELPNKHMDELRHYLMPNVDRVRDLLFSGHHPSHIYYNAITDKTYPCMVTRPNDERDRDHRTLCFECEHSQEYLLNTFLWSLFYVDQPRYLQLMTYIHSSPSTCSSNGSKDVPVSSFARTHSIRSLNSILTSDSIDRTGRMSTWRVPKASAVRNLMLDIIKSFVGQCLLSHGVDDLERLQLSPPEVLSEENFERSYKSHRKWTSSGGDARDRDNKQDTDEMLCEVLAIFIDNPQFVYVRQSDDDGTKHDGVISSHFTSQLTLLLRDVTSIVRLADDDILSLRAEEAFLILVDVKYIGLWNPQDPLIGVMAVQAIILKHLSYQLLHCEATEEHVTLRLLNCVYCLLKNVNLYLEEDQLLRDVSFSTETFYMSTYCVVHQSIWLTEAALLLHLCSSDMDVIGQVSLCLEAWCTHAVFVSRIEIPLEKVDAPSEQHDESGGKGDSDSEEQLPKLSIEDDWKPYYWKIKSPEYMDIFIIYGEMSSSVRSILSQKLQQKSIRSYLHSMPCRTLGMKWALTSVMMRWESFNDVILQTTKVCVPDCEASAFDEWTNYTGFLCTMGRDLFTHVVPCPVDSLVPYLGCYCSDQDVGAVFRLRSATSYSIASSGSEGLEQSKSSTPTSTCTKLIKELLYLILLQHAEKRVSFDVFFAVGLSLSPPLIHHLFRELYIILDVMTDVLAKRCDTCTTIPSPQEPPNTSGKKRSKSSNNIGSNSTFIQNFIDFDIFIAEMPLASVNSFVNAIFTMLQMIFDREWRNGDRDSSSSPLNGNAAAPGDTRDSFDDVNFHLSGNQIICLVEKLFYKVISLESKLHRQLEISDSTSNNSLTAASSPLSPSTSHSTTSDTMRAKDNYIIEQFRLRKKMASMVETFMLQTTPSFKISAALQMKLLSILMEWVYDCIGYIASTTQTQKSSEELSKSRSALNSVGSKESIALYQSTQLASMKAIVALLKGFELIAIVEGGGEDDTMSPAPAAPSTSKNNQVHHKSSASFEVSKAFYRAFHILHKLLDICLQNNSDATVITRGVTINALCNLLHGNTGIGLKHMIETANSSENQQIRGVLLSVFTETLSRRVDLLFGDDGKHTEDSYEDCLLELLAFVIAPDRELIRLLCVATRSGKDATLLACALLNLFEDLPDVKPGSTCSGEKRDVQLLEWAIEFELSQTARLGSLFRSESLCTKLMGTFFSSKGGVYLRDTLRAPVELFLERTPCVEVDPHKGVDAEDISDNTARLLQYAELFLEAIVSSVEKCPKEIRHILFLLREEASLRFAGLETGSESERVAIAGYMFLRFFCPAIAMPTKFDLVLLSTSEDGINFDSRTSASPTLSRQSSRGLLLIAKILQNLANGTHFFEECMSSLNTWIDDHVDDILRFTDAIVLLDAANLCSLKNRNNEGTDLTNHSDDVRGRSSLSINTGGNGSGESSNTWINEKQIDVLTTIHTFMYCNSERIERLLFPQNIKALSNEVIGETPISPGLIPTRSVSRQGSKSDLAQLDGVPNSASGLSGAADVESEFMVIRDPLSALLSKLGEPPEEGVDHTASDAFGTSQRLGQTNDKNDKNISACSHFMTDFESRPEYLDLLQSVRDNMIFYSSNLSVSEFHSSSPNSSYNHEIFFFIARRVTSDTDPSALIYFILMELRRFIDHVNQERDKDKEKPVSAPVFDLVIDSSSFNTDSELPMWSYTSFWSKLKNLVGRTFGKYFKKAYVMYPSVVLLMSTLKILKKWGLKTKAVMERVEVCTPSQLIAKYSSLQEKIPHTTYNIETTSLKHWPAVYQQQQVMITISSSMLLVQSKEKLGGLEFIRTDMLFLYLIESVFKSSINSGLKSKKHGGGTGSDKFNRKKFSLPGGLTVGDEKKDNYGKAKSEPLVVINYTASHSKRTFKLQFVHTPQFLSALSIALTQVRQQRALEEASESAATDTLSPVAIPGTLLHVAMLNLFSDTMATRKASFLLLCQLKETYELSLISIPGGATELSALFVPTNLIQYCVSISTDIAASHPEYGREFIAGCFHAVKTPVTSQSQKVALIRCVAPWIPYLGLYLDYARDRDHSGSGDLGAMGLFDAEGQAYHRTGGESPFTTGDPPIPSKAHVARTPSKRGSVPVAVAGNVTVRSLRAVSLQPARERRMSLAPPLDDRSSSCSPGTSVDDISGVLTKYEGLGSWILEATSDAIIQEIKYIVEVAICSSSEDSAIATIFHSHFWENIAHLPGVSAFAVHFLIRRLSQEALNGCSTPLIFSGLAPRKSEGEVVDAGCTNTGSETDGDYFLESDAVLVAPFAMYDFGSGLQATGGGISFDRDETHNQALFSTQGSCRFCVVMCEAIAILGAKSHVPEQPVTVCLILLTQIKQLIESIFLDDHKKCNNSSGNGCPVTSSTVKFNIDINDDYIGRGKSHSDPPQGKYKASEGDDPFSRFSTSVVDENVLFKHQQDPSQLPAQQIVSAQLFVEEESDSNSEEGFEGTSPSMGSHHDYSGDDILTPQKNFSHNADAFFTLPVPPSPANTPQKSKHISTEAVNPTVVANPMSSLRPGPTRSLPRAVKSNSKWFEVIALLRPLLYLIFKNPTVLEHCTPDILHLSLKLLAKGPRSVHPGVFTLLSTLVHALLSESVDEIKFSASGVHRPADEDERISFGSGLVSVFSGADASAWREVLNQMDSPSFHFIFNKPPELTSNNFEVVAGFMTEVVSCPSSELSNQWKHSLWDLALKSSMKRFTYILTNGSGAEIVASCPVYPSYFYLLGNLIDVDKASVSYFKHIFSSFQDVIKLCSEYNFVDNCGEAQVCLDKIEDKMMRPIFFCLSRSLKFLDILGLQRLFWCTILLLQYFPEHYLSGPVLLLHSVSDELLESLPPGAGEKSSQFSAAGEINIDTCGDHGGDDDVRVHNVTSALLDMRRSDSSLRQSFDVIEGSNLLGLSFESSFSTALTSTLLRLFNVKDAKTKTLTVDILQKLLQHDQATYCRPLLTRQSPRRGCTETDADTIHERAGLERGISGYCPVLLPHLGLEESDVSRPLIRPDTISNAPPVNPTVLTERNEISTATVYTKASRPPLVKKKSVPSLVLAGVTIPSTRGSSATLVPKNAMPTYLSALSPSAKSQFVSPAFFGKHNFPSEKSIVLFVTSLLGYLRLLAQSVYSDEEQQSHSFAFIILLQVLREVPVALNKLYHVIFAELNTTYNLSSQRNHYLADIVMEAIHECLLSKTQLAPDRGSHVGSNEDSVEYYRGEFEDDDNDLLVERKNIKIRTRHAGQNTDVSFVEKIKSTILDKDKNRDGSNMHFVNVMREDVDFDSDEGGIDDESSSGFNSPLETPPSLVRKRLESPREGATGMPYLADLGFSALLSGPYSFIFSSCGKCLPLSRSCPCYKDRQDKKDLLSSSALKIVDNIMSTLK